MNTSPHKRTYTAEQRAAALAEVTLQGGNLRKAAAITGIPRATISWWARAAEQAGTPLPPGPCERVDFAQLWHDTQVAALAKLGELLDQAATPKEAAYIAGLAADKFLDFTQGRRGHQINVDARSVSPVFAISDAERHQILAAALGVTAADGLDDGGG